MILFVTSRCNGNCIHCLSRCTENGIDMDMKTFRKSLQFIRKVNPSILNVSGGEPTLHPDITYLLKSIRMEFPKIILTLISNGTFVRNEEVYNSLKNLNIPYFMIQVTYNKELYETNLTPKEMVKLKQISHLVIAENEPPKENILAYGRALDNQMPTSSTRISPFCYNIRSIIRKGGLNLKDAVKFLESNHKFCCPSIRPDGTIGISESLCCPEVGTIHEDIEIISNRIAKFDCTNCEYATKGLHIMEKLMT